MDSLIKIPQVFLSKIQKKITLEKEKKFKNSNCTLNYLFFKNRKSKKLLVVFSAFPGKNDTAHYNYITSFKALQCSKLYILDNFGPDGRGSYYLGENRNFYIEKAVNELIVGLVSKLHITLKDVIACGSSKGGYAALYFSFKYGYGSAFAGSPQTLLGNYLKNKERILTYIAGNTDTKDVNFLNSLLIELAEKSTDYPNVYIHVGKTEHHYTEHVIPFINVLEKKNIPYTLDLKDYSEHGDVGIYFPPFVIENVKKYSMIS